MEIVTGKLTKPERVVIYGPEGIGKSTLAAQWPAPVFVDTEGSTDQMDVARTPRPASWGMLLATIGELTRDPHGFQTLVLDTADWAEKLAVQEVCAKGKKDGIEDFGYGKGYTYLEEEWQRLLAALDKARDAGLQIVVTAHATMRKFEQPDEAGAYDRWELKLSKKCSPMLKEWAGMVLFANYRTIVVEVDSGKKQAKGGQRVLYTTHHPAWDAKNRHGLPEMIALPAAGLPKELAAALGLVVAEAKAAPAKAVRKAAAVPPPPALGPAPLPADPDVPADLQPATVAAPAPTTATQPASSRGAEAAPTQEAKPAPKAGPVAEDKTAFNADLYQRMTLAKVSEEEVERYLREVRKMHLSLHNLPADFVRRMIANWDKVQTWIETNRAAKQSAA